MKGRNASLELRARDVGVIVAVIALLVSAFLAQVRAHADAEVSAPPPATPVAAARP